MSNSIRMSICLCPSALTKIAVYLANHCKHQKGIRYQYDPFSRFFSRSAFAALSTFISVSS